MESISLNDLGYDSIQAYFPTMSGTYIVYLNGVSEHRKECEEKGIWEKSNSTESFLEFISDLSVKDFDSELIERLRNNFREINTTGVVIKGLSESVDYERLKEIARTEYNRIEKEHWAGVHNRIARELQEQYEDSMAMHRVSANLLFTPMTT